LTFCANIVALDSGIKLIIKYENNFNRFHGRRENSRGEKIIKKT